MTTITKKRVPPDAFRLDGEALQFELLAADPAQPTVKREWSMVANTGKAMQRWWGELMLDLDGAKFRQKVGLLLDHSTDQRLGYSTEVRRTPRGLEAKGRLLDNEHANLVLKESQQGFPFQASLMAVASRVQVLDEGEEATCNGQTVQGPVAIFREWNLRELTLTVLGADDDTATEAFATNGETEIEIMTTKTKDPASEPGTPTSLALATKPDAPAPINPPAAEAPKAEDLAAKERKRANAILAAADPVQTELAHKLVADGTDLPEALAQLNANLKERMGAMRVQLREGTTPMSTGNAAGRDGSGSGTEDLNAEEPSPEKWDKQWKLHAQVREEYRLPGMSEADGKKRFVASQKFAAKFLPGGDRLSVVGGERFGATETHLQPLTERGIRGDFYLGLEGTEESWINDIATTYSTDAPSEDYPFLGQVPRLRKFEGPRAEQELNRGKLTIVNEDYEDTFVIAGKDWRRDKSGQMALRVQEMGEAAGELPIDLISQLLITGHTTALAWDGVALFGSHTWGKSGTIDNDLGTGDGLAGSAAPTSAQMAENIFLAIMRLLSFKDDQGRPFNTRARSFKIMVPTNMIRATEAALADQFTSAGVSNTLATALGRGAFSISYVWNPRLTATDTFFLWRNDARVKPFIYQQEFIKPPYLLAEGSEHFKRHNKVEIGVHASGGAAPGKYELIVRGKTA